MVAPHANLGEAQGVTTDLHGGHGNHWCFLGNLNQITIFLCAIFDSLAQHSHSIDK